MLPRNMTERYNPGVDTIGPRKDSENRVIYAHAKEIPYVEGASLWQRRIESLELDDASSSHQVIIIPTDSLTKNIKDANYFPFRYSNRVAYTDTIGFEDGEDITMVRNEMPGIKHATIIGSPATYSDLFHIMQTADHYKQVLGTKHITLIAPSLMTPRQDKNVDSATGEYTPSTINIHTTIAALSAFVDSFIVIEPHSFSTQTTASEYGKPLFPITPWRYLMNESAKRGAVINGKKFVINRENTLFARPDKGRNIAASRSSEFYHLDHVSFDKIRLTPTQINLSLPPNEVKMVKDKLCIVYDDELASCGTVGTMADRLGEYGALGLAIVAVHGKFTGNWERNINNPMIKKIFISDATKPIGNIDKYVQSGKIEVIPMQPFISQILAADLAYTNFWLDPEYSHMVLQTNESDKSII